MKRLTLILFTMFILFIFIGCDLKESSNRSSLTPGQQKALDNSIEYINNSSFSSKYHIDKNIIKINNASENTWKAAFHEGSHVKENEVDGTDWVITIGNTLSQDFVSIVCDSNTYEVIGYIPIE